MWCEVIALSLVGLYPHVSFDDARDLPKLYRSGVRNYSTLAHTKTLKVTQPPGELLDLIKDIPIRLKCSPHSWCQQCCICPSFTRNVAVDKVNLLKSEASADPEDVVTNGSFDVCVNAAVLKLINQYGNIMAVVWGQEFLRACYFTSWSKYRASQVGRYDIEDIDPKLCSHLIYAFGKLDKDSKRLEATEPSMELDIQGLQGRYRKFNNLKTQANGLKTLLSVGGQNDEGQGFKAIIENDMIRKEFATTTMAFLREHNFDGLDLDWEFPEKEHKQQFVSLLKVLQETFSDEGNGDKLILTIAGGAGKHVIDDGYDVPNIARYVDYVHLMTYDYHVGGSEVAAFNSPLYSRHDPRFDQTLSMNWTVHYWHTLGLPYSKALVGVTGVGRHYVLENINNTDVGDAVTQEVKVGYHYKLEYGLAYPEICMMKSSNATQTYFDLDQSVPYLVQGDSWVGYEDPKSLEIKVKWMMEMGVAGIMFWSLDQDDFTGEICHEGKYPLLSAVTKSMEDVSDQDTSCDTCSGNNGQPSSQRWQCPHTTALQLAMLVLSAVFITLMPRYL